jgi:MoaA/NifB/PqqE/SkfB family radical SAM enzyme
MTNRHVLSEQYASPASELTEMVLDGSKVQWHQERVEKWQRWMVSHRPEDRVAPITIDMALTRECQAGCTFCYAVLQENERKPITRDIVDRFLEDTAEIGVKGISLVSDGESTMSPEFAHFIRRGHELGISMASGTNGFKVTKDVSERVLSGLDYIRINFDAANADSYGRIMGVKPAQFGHTVRNVQDMLAIKRRDSLDTTIGLQMVLMPQYGEEIIPLAKLAIDLGVDYLVIKHCSDDEKGSLGVNYQSYEQWYPTLREAESMSTEQTLISVKWSKIMAEGKRDYAQCFGAPFIIQLSGSGLVAPCGMMFNEMYRKFHIGNIVDQSFKEMWESERYWHVMEWLAGEKFDARTMCGSLCLQHKTNEVLRDIHEGAAPAALPTGEQPQHLNFI